jgi:hypothetical protein
MHRILRPIATGVAVGLGTPQYTPNEMSRTSVLLVMLFAMLWQTVALARAGSTVSALADMEHTALHWQEEGHHHHEDGSYHLDDSPESVQHVIADHVSASAALLVSTSHGFPPPESAAPAGLLNALVPDPDPEGLLRPPRFHS